VTRRELLTSILAAVLARPALAAGSGEEDPVQPGAADAIEPLDVPHAAWKPLVSPQAYAVLFEEATERPFSSPLEGKKDQGTFLCAACLLPLFRSDTKFDSGTGWPSFFDVLPGHVGTRRDFKLIVPRTEYHCARCGGHQGHVFRDGPPPTGLRYCNNGVALRFVPEGSELPALRRPPA
jgi:peptide-methionine (R)-S-oxide reductase